MLALWAVLAIGCNLAPWVAGVAPDGLAAAVERGVAREESARVGEVGDDLIRKAIKLQRETLPFWTTLTLLGDFVAEPAGLALRAGAVAVIFASIAALSGRPVGFAEGLAGSARAQGFWVLGLAVRAGLVIALGRGDVETSLALLLPPGRHPAALVVAARQVEPLALLGWLAMARGGWRRGQVNLAGAIGVVALMAACEAAMRMVFALTVGAGSRLAILPS